MSALTRYWHNFARWVKRGHAQPLPLLQPIPAESWVERKIAFERAKRAHHGQRDAYAHLRKATNERLLRDALNKDDRALIEMTHTHPWLFRDADTIAFVEAVKATARQSVQEARR